MKISIVGGAGFVGHNLAIDLVKAGHNVLCVDSLAVNNIVHAAHAGNDLYVRFIQQRLALLNKHHIGLSILDARNYHELSRAVSGFRPDVVIHLAAVAHIDRANKDPFTTFDHSLRTLENSLDVCRAVGAGLIFFSSSTVYGDFSHDVITESEPLKPFGIYGNLKLAAERMCLSYNQVYDLPVCVIRPQALYGPRCISGRVTQVFIERARQGLPLIINGPSGHKHDFTWIGDLSQGVRLVAEKMPRTFEVYNLTGESATSLADLSAIVVARYPVEVHRSDADSGKPRRGTMSCAKLRDHYGYRPQTPILEGMTQYMAWYDGR